MIKRTLRGFKKLKNKYYTPEVKAKLSAVGKGLVAAEKGSNSLVGNDDPFGTSGMFSNQFDSRSDIQGRGNSFSDNNQFLMGFQQRPMAPVKKRTPVKKRKKYYYPPVRRDLRRRVYQQARRKARRKSKPQPQQQSRDISNYWY